MIDRKVKICIPNDAFMEIVSYKDAQTAALKQKHAREIAALQTTNRELNRRVGALEHALTVQSEKRAWKRYFDAAITLYERAINTPKEAK